VNIKELIGYQPPKNIDELIHDSIQLDAPFQHFATVMVQEPNGIIKGIGQSRRNNLILDHFGEILAEMFTAPSADQVEITLTDIAGAPFVMQFYGDDSANDFSVFRNDVGNPLGTLIQVGAGVTAATRADIAIETPFIVAPEDAGFHTGSGSYAGGAIAVVGAIAAGGAGTINEVILILRGLDNAGAATGDIALFHDILVAGEAFVLGETITVTYTINL